MKKNIALLSTLLATPIISGVGLIATSCANHNDDPKTTEDINLVGTNKIEMFSSANNYLGKLSFELNEPLDGKTLTCEISSQTGKMTVSIDGDIAVNGKDVQVYLSSTHADDISIGDQTTFSLTFKIGDEGETILDKTIDNLSIQYIKSVPVPTTSLDIDSDGNLFGLTDS
ncbi:MAG: hypothetical protein MJ201_03240 [Mycoplasmoidaceae bacterium]|nr:hypothetical protein [Mycoplasmoidaceae bacterium]